MCTELQICNCCQILKPSDSLFVNLQILQFTILRCLVSKPGWLLILGGGLANWNVPFPLIVARVLAVAGRRRCNNQRTKAVNLLSSVGTWTHLFHLLFPPSSDPKVLLCIAWVHPPLWAAAITGKLEQFSNLQLRGLPSPHCTPASVTDQSWQRFLQIKNKFGTYHVVD